MTFGFAYYRAFDVIMSCNTLIQIEHARGYCHLLAEHVGEDKWYILQWTCDIVSKRIEQIMDGI